MLNYLNELRQAYKFEKMIIIMSMDEAEHHSMVQIKIGASESKCAYLS